MTTPTNLQNLDIRPTPREEMNLYRLDTFAYEYVGREIWVEFAIPEFTAICPFSDFPDFAVIRLSDLLRGVKMFYNFDLAVR